MIEDMKPRKRQKATWGDWLIILCLALVIGAVLYFAFQPKPDEEEYVIPTSLEAVDPQALTVVDIQVKYGDIWYSVGKIESSGETTIIPGEKLRLMTSAVRLAVKDGNHTIYTYLTKGGKS